MERRLRGSRKRALLLVSVVGLLSVVLTGCGSGTSPQGAPPAHTAHKTMWTADVQLNWLKNVEFSGLWIADHFHWFEHAGIKLNATAWSNGITPSTTVHTCWQSHSSHTLCFGFDDASAVAIARSVGNDVKAVWVGSQKSPFGLMTCYVPNKKCKSNGGKNITKPSQLKGLTIGYQSHELYVPEIMLGNVGLSLQDVKLVNAEFNTGELTDGTVDAYLVFTNNEPLALQLQGVRTNVIPAYKWGMQDFYADSMFAPDQELKANPKEVRTFVRLVDKGWKWAMHHPQQAASIIQKNYFKVTSPSYSFNLKQQKLEEEQFAKTLSRDASGKVSGRMTLSRWKGMVKVLLRSKASINGGPIISHKINASAAFTNKFAPPASK